MKRIFLVIALLAAGLALRAASAGQPFAAAQTAPVDAAVEQAILAAVKDQQDVVLAYLVHDLRVDQLAISPDGEWAVAWLVLADRATGELLPTEPGLAIARRVGDASSAAGWQALLPADAGWAEAVRAAPDSLLPAETRQAWLQRDIRERAAALPQQTFSGYRLPWAAGATVYLSQSTGHDQWDASYKAHYAFDFYNGTMFNLYAAKGGVVHLAKWTCANYDPNCANWLVIKDTSTIPTTYALYLHLAYDSIPPSLRAAGAPVARGQFIGQADDTGLSTGHHLHFHVHLNPNSYWDQSQDITFDDVAINGGRPRRNDAYVQDFEWCWPSDVCDDSAAAYVSGNTPTGDTTPPVGALAGLQNGDLILSASLALQATASDSGSGLKSAQFVAYFNEAWRDIGPEFGASPLNYTWDLCAAGVPDGLVSVALRLRDWDGNQDPVAGLVHLTKNYACPESPPECAPAAHQAALFESAGYSGCVLFAVGEYANGAALGALGDNDAAALRLGSGVALTLFSDADFTGRSETFFVDDNNLSDNRIGADSVSAMRVFLRPALPSAPALRSPAAGAALPAGDLIPLVWQDGGGASEFQLAISDGLTTTFTAWQAAPLFFLQTSAPTLYQWQARARSDDGESAWSAWQSFTITTTTSSQPSFTAPYSDDMEGTEARWLASGLWRLVDDANLANSDPHAWWYQETDGNYATGAPTAGGLTSPFIGIPASGEYFLRFRYRYETESARPHWDQRWVQISANGGPFTNVWQLGDDPNMGDSTSWLQSRPLSLAAYAGQTIRVRFYFDTLDAANNSGRGWGVDDFSVTATAPASCSDAHEPNDDPASAAPIAIGQTFDAVICPNGDLDTFVFSGSAGQRIAADVDAQSIGSSLDSYLYLLAGDGAGVLAEHDDEIYSVQRDSHIEFTLPASGVYYLKIREWKNPDEGGSAYTYRIGLYEDEQNPQISLLTPPDGGVVGAQATLQATASDSGSGVARVEFWWHNNDWRAGEWQNLGSDSDGADGWSLAHDFSAEGDQSGAALYAYAYDRAGNRLGAGAWELLLDVTPPVSALQPLAAAQPANAFRLRWSGSDNSSGLSVFDLQQAQNGGGWSLLASVAGGDSSFWVVGDPGASYAYRLRAVDAAGNAEAYPSSAETATAIPAASELCAAPDAYESDNTPATAAVLTLGSASAHNFCNPLVAGWQADEDWAQVSVQAGNEYLFIASPLHEAAAPQLRLFAADGVTLLAESGAGGFGHAAALRWQATAGGVLYVQVIHADSRVIGAGYTLLAQPALPVFLPVVWSAAAR